MYFYYKMYTICKLFYNTLSPSGELCISSFTSFTDFLPPANPKKWNAVNLMYVNVRNLGIVGIILLIRYWHQYSISDCSHGLLLRSVRIYRKYSHLKHEGLTPISLARDFFILSILYGVAGECLSGMRSRKDMQTVSLMCIGDTAVQCTQAYYEDSL